MKKKSFKKIQENLMRSVGFLSLARQTQTQSAKATLISPEVRAWMKAQPEGAPAYLERLVMQDMAARRCAAASNDEG